MSLVFPELAARLRRALAGRAAASSPARGLAPIAIQPTPGSVLVSTAPLAVPPYFIEKRRRLATCGGAAWFHGLHLVTVNLAGSAIHVYRFDPDDRTFTLVQALVDPAGLAHPENLAFSPDEALLAVTSTDGALNVYSVDRTTPTIGATPMATAKAEPPFAPHGVSFSPSGRRLVVSTIEHPGGLRCFAVVRGPEGGIELTCVQVLVNRRPPLRPKGVAIAPDGRFIAIAYSANASPKAWRGLPGLLAIHRFSDAEGCSPEPVSTTGRGLGLRDPEDVNFLPDGSHVVITDQATDSATLVAFNRLTGELGGTALTIENPSGRLSFPHGNAVSGDGRFLAIASYGDDKLTVYDLKPYFLRTIASASSSG